MTWRPCASMLIQTLRSWDSGSHRDRRRFLGLDRLLPWGQHPRGGAPRWVARRHADRDRRPDPGGGGAGLPAGEGWGLDTPAVPLPGAAVDARHPQCLEGSRELPGTAPPRHHGAQDHRRDHCHSLQLLRRSPAATRRTCHCSSAIGTFCRMWSTWGWRPPEAAALRNGDNLTP